jgi:hypothetical protein
MVPTPTLSHPPQPSQSPIAPALSLCQCILPPQWLALPGTSSSNPLIISLHIKANVFFNTVHHPLSGIRGLLRPAPRQPHRLPQSTPQAPLAGLAGPQLLPHPQPPQLLLSPPTLPLHGAQPLLLTPPSLVLLTRSLLKPVLVLLPSLVSLLTSCKRFHLA